jgi:hypothetical protein
MDSVHREKIEHLGQRLVEENEIRDAKARNEIYLKMSARFAAVRAVRAL